MTVPGWILAASSSSWTLRRISCCRPASETPTCSSPRKSRSGLGLGRVPYATWSYQDCPISGFWHLLLETRRPGSQGQCEAVQHHSCEDPSLGQSPTISMAGRETGAHWETNTGNAIEQHMLSL